MSQTDDTRPDQPASIADAGCATGTTVYAVCWECGAERLCVEYVVCCTGTMFHVCPECLAKLENQEKR
jgi:hypothetical protein